MAYELPLARVYQELINVSPTIASPQLPACIIGRCYHVLTYVDNRSEIFTANYNKTSGNTFPLPNNKPGAILEPSFSKLYMDDMYIEIDNGSFDSTINTNTITDVTATFITDGVIVGDKVKVAHSSIPAGLERIVIEIVSETEIKINKNFTASMTGATYSVQRKLNDRLMESSAFTIDENVVTVLPSLSHTYEGTSYLVMSGQLYFEYKALRTDLASGLDNANSTDDITSKLGAVTAENPLALGVKMARDNTITPVNFLGVDTVEGDDLGWSNVRDILENTTSVYFLALLTDKSSIITAFKSHCEAMSTADEHGWRVCSGGVELIKVKTIVEESDVGEIFNNGGIKTFRDNDAEFITDGVSPADRLEITVGTVTGSYVVNRVVNDNVIEVTTDNPFPATGTGLTYTIERDMNKSQQADEIAATIDSYNSKRVIIVYPDLIEVSGEQVNGYFLGCILAGMVAGLPPHQGFTNLTIAGVDRLYNANTYFKKTDLNKIAGAGGCIFVQSTINSAPYVRHQLTTDTQFVETKELSVVKNFDHLSYYFYDVISPFIGVYNITDATVKLVLDSITLAARKKMSETLPKIGAPLKAFTLEGGVSAVSSDRVRALARLDLPKPMNYIDLYLAI